MKEKAKVVEGVVRWVSNGQVPPEDCFATLQAEGLEFSAEKSRAAREAETAAFLREYRKRHRRSKPSGEELAEMRAAFGKGTTVVNVITGRRTRL